MTPFDVGLWFRDTVLSGSMALALPVALVAGLVSFFSPCVVPLLPGYLSYATGLSGVDLENARRGRMVLGSLLFVLGFSFVFVVLGTLSGLAFTDAASLSGLYAVLRRQRRRRDGRRPGRSHD